SNNMPHPPRSSVLKAHPRLPPRQPRQQLSAPRPRPRTHTSSPDPSDPTPQGTPSASARGTPPARIAREPRQPPTRPPAGRHEARPPLLALDALEQDRVLMRVRRGGRGEAH